MLNLPEGRYDAMDIKYLLWACGCCGPLSVELFGEGTLRRWGLAEGNESVEGYSLAWIPGLVHQDVIRQLVLLPL